MAQVSRGGANTKTLSNKNMKDHLERHHRDAYEEYERILEANKPKSILLKAGQGGLGVVSASPARSEQYAATLDALVELIVDSFLPWNFATRASTAHFARTLLPSARLPKDTRDVKMAAVRMKLRLMKEIDEVLRAQYVSIAFDMWTSNKGDTFVGVTFHFIDEHWNLRTVKLDLEKFVGGTTAVELAQKMPPILLKRTVAGVWSLITDCEGSMVIHVYALYAMFNLVCRPCTWCQTCEVCTYLIIITDGRDR